MPYGKLKFYSVDSNGRAIHIDEEHFLWVIEFSTNKKGEYTGNMRYIMVL